MKHRTNAVPVAQTGVIDKADVSHTSGQPPQYNHGDHFGYQLNLDLWTRRTTVIQAAKPQLELVSSHT